MTTVHEIYRYLDGLAPFRRQMEFDNSGFLVGRGETEVRKVLVALDITGEVAHEAAALGVQMVVSHHPVIFRPRRSITDDDLVGRILLTLAENRIAAVCAHTNLDVAVGGVNDALAQTLELEDVTHFEVLGHDPDGAAYSVGRIGNASGPRTGSLTDFAAFVKERLGTGGVRCVDAGLPVHRVAVGGGACGEYVEKATALGCDTFVTSDMKYNQFLDAKALGLNVIDAGHFSTENVVCPVLAAWLRKGFPDLEVVQSACHREVFSYL